MTSMEKKFEDLTLTHLNLILEAKDAWEDPEDILSMSCAVLVAPWASLFIDAPDMVKDATKDMIVGIIFEQLNEF